MIIIETKNGVDFVNEKEAVMVCHNKEKNQVSFHTRETMQGVTIHDVESITFTTDAHPMEMRYHGSEIERLQDLVKHEIDHATDLMVICNKQSQIIKEYALFLRRISPMKDCTKVKTDVILKRLSNELELLDMNVREKYPNFDIYSGCDSKEDRV